MPGKDNGYALPSWAMPLAEKSAEVLRGIARHRRDAIEMDMAHQHAERAFWDVLSLAAGDVYLSWQDRENLTAMVTARRPVTVRQALKTITDSRRPPDRHT